MRRPCAPLLALRTLVTLALCAVIAQAGWAAAALGGEPGYWSRHGTGAVVALVVAQHPHRAA